MSDWASDPTQNRMDLEELVAANQRSTDTMLSLIDTVRQETAARDRKIFAMEKQQKQLRLAIALVCVGISILVLVGIINATNIYNTRKQQDQLAAVAVEVDQANRVLLDCINATGECGRVNAQHQKELLDEVKKYELVGFYCIRLNPATADPKAEAFLKCMERLYPNGPVLEDR